MSFDPGSSSLRFALCWPPSIGTSSLRFVFCWPPSIGAGNSKVTSFDWALAGARSCPLIGQRQQQVVSFDWDNMLCLSIGLWQGRGPVLRLEAGSSKLYPSTGAWKSVWKPKASFHTPVSCFFRLNFLNSNMA